MNDRHRESGTGPGLLLTLASDSTFSKDAEMKIASWNVNSIRARLGRVTEWLASRQPDVVCLQELKVEEKNFPALELRAAGYQSVQGCQKTYNGVANLARQGLAEAAYGVDDGVDDPQARLGGATFRGARVLSVYAPNGP